MRCAYAPRCWRRIRYHDPSLLNDRMLIKGWELCLEFLISINSKISHQITQIIKSLWTCLTTLQTLAPPRALLVQPEAPGLDTPRPAAARIVKVWPSKILDKCSIKSVRKPLLLQRLWLERVQWQLLPLLQHVNCSHCKCHYQSLISDWKIATEATTIPIQTALLTTTMVLGLPHTRSRRGGDKVSRCRLRIHSGRWLAFQVVLKSMSGAHVFPFQHGKVICPLPRHAPLISSIPRLSLWMK